MRTARVLDADLDGLDRIDLSGLEAEGVHGAFAEEKTGPQELVVDVRIWLAPDAVVDDDLATTVNYVEAADRVRDAVATSSFDLIESLAEHLCGELLADPAALAVEVTIHKPGAARYNAATDVTVRVRRRRA